MDECPIESENAVQCGHAHMTWSRILDTRDIQSLYSNFSLVTVKVA